MCGELLIFDTNQLFATHTFDVEGEHAVACGDDRKCHRKQNSTKLRH